MDGEQRVAAEREEVVLHSHGGDAQQVRPQAREQLLHGGPRRAAAAALRRRRLRQGVAVDLAVGIERQRVEEDEERRHHEIGKLPPQPAPQARSRRPPRRRPRRHHRQHHPGDEPLLSLGVTSHSDRRRGDAGQRRERGLDLAGLDAEAADLDLRIEPPEELDAGVRQASGEVAGAVQALAGMARIGVGNEAIGGEVRAAEVAACETAPPAQSSPGAPTATGASPEPRIVTRVPPTGRPIGSEPRPRSRRAIGWQVVKVVFSVGP